MEFWGESVDPIGVRVKMSMGLSSRVFALRLRDPARVRKVHRSDKEKEGS